MQALAEGDPHLVGRGACSPQPKPVVSRVITHLQEQTVVWSLVSYASESSATLNILIDMGLRRQIVRSALVIIWSFFVGSALSHRLGKDMNTGIGKSSSDRLQAA
jgi:hypothetical protein